MLRSIGFKDRVLNNDVSACAYENKTEELCGNCIRYLNQWDIDMHTLWTEFKPVKNFKTKVIKCEGFRKS